MSKQELETVAQSMVAKGKGILAADPQTGDGGLQKCRRRVLRVAYRL